MNLPEINTNSQLYKEYWGDEDDNRFACALCGEPWPNKVQVYPDHTRVCGDRHKSFHKAYAILERLEHELLGDDFNALSVCLELSRKGII